MLVDLCCAGDGAVHACGREGLLLKGRQSSWQKVDLGSFAEDIWSLAWFQDRLYLATMENVLALTGAGPKVVRMGKDAPKTCYDLVTGAGMLWSIGAKDIMSFDGKSRTRIDLSGASTRRTPRP